MTLVDTSLLQGLRDQGNWSNVYKNIPRTILYPGIYQLVRDLSKTYLLGVVTSSPRPYAEKVLHFHSLQLKVLAAYHDTECHKPLPAPLFHGCQQLGLSPTLIVSIGDEINDYKASVAASIDYIHAAWSNKNNTDLPTNVLCNTVADLRIRLLK